MTRKEALIILADLPELILEAIALVIETADTQGDYHYDSQSGEGSVWEDDVQETLNYLATEIRSL